MASWRYCASNGSDSIRSTTNKQFGAPSFYSQFGAPSSIQRRARIRVRDRSSKMNAGDLHKVWEVKALKKPGEEDARRTLDRIAKQVQPIMRRRKWRVKVLSEFCPTNPSLLGLNVGSGVQVKLRLRRHGRDWDFIPFEQVLDTMLHELCHNQIGPHNAEFYKLWDELRKECDELMAKGISGTGQGFDAPGRRLGGFSHQPPLSSLRQTALAAAEKRRRVGDLLPSGPRRLGGNSDIMSALSPIQAAAMAAERRMLDDLWCGSVSQEDSSSVDGSSVIEERPASVEPGESSKSSNVTEQRRPDIKKRGDNHGYMGSLIVIEDEEDKLTWECSVCTLFNKLLALICEACCAQKPDDVGSKFKTWSCKFCTLKNDTKLDKCAVCGQWRYSFGPPISTLGPNYGT